MFFVKGWTFLGRVTNEALDAHERTLPSPEIDSALSDDEIGAIALSMILRGYPDFTAFVWDKLGDFAESGAVGCTTASGVTVLMDRWLLDPVDPGEPQGLYIDLYEGFVGSGVTEDYGPLFDHFFGLPVVVREREARSLISEAGALALAERKLRPDAHYVGEIVEAYDTGKPVTKAWVRKEITGRIKVAEFEAIWEQARSIRPDLSKSGPRGPRRNPG